MSTGWLPLQRKEHSIPRKNLTLKDIKDWSHNDWFLRLASAISDRGGPEDSIQGRNLAKAYYFLRDYFPQGLTGKHEAIKGNDVMHAMLCHTSDTSRSRHKLTRDADVAWKDLASWMSDGRTWQDVLQKRKSGRSKQTKRKGGSKAPGLYTPAQFVAILIIGYPASMASYKNQIGELQIEWMLESRHTLHVKSGFWKGLTADQLDDVFTPPEDRVSSIMLHADYTLLFGDRFLSCQSNIRPYVEPWAKELSLQDDQTAIAFDFNNEGDPSSVRGTEATTEPPVIQESVRDDDDLYLFLASDDANMTSTHQLKDWLIQKLMRDSPLLVTWCRFWAGRMDSAESYADQLIHRSLFLHSLTVLKRLSNLPSSVTSVHGVLHDIDLQSAFLILDMEDAAPGPHQHASEQAEVLAANIGSFGDYDACTRANSVLQGHLAGTPCSELNGHIARRQIFFLSSVIIKHFKLCKDVMILDALRIQLIHQRLSSGSLPTASPVYEAKIRSALHLTTWQLQRLFAEASNPQAVLTKAQYKVYCQRFLPGSDTTGDLSSMSIGQLCRMSNDTSENVIASVEDMKQVLSKLFGDILQPLIRPKSTAVGSMHTIENISVSQTPEPEQQAPSITSIFSVQCSPAPSQDIVSPTKTAITDTPSSIAPRDREPGSIKADNDNPFAGKQWLGRKRPGADIEMRPSKTLRLRDMTVDRLQDELRGNTEILISKITTEVAHALQQTTDQVTERVGGDLALLIRECIQSGFADASSVILGSLTTHLINISGELTSACASQSNQLEAKLNSVIAEMNAKKTPKVGQEGYLARCTAPAGVEQTSYEAMLMLAAFFYFGQLGNPVDGAGPDEDALKETVQQFPGASRAHIVIALKHAHMITYKQPFSEG